MSIANPHSDRTLSRATISWGDIPVWHLMGLSILFSAAFFNLVSLDSNKDEVKLDGQVYLKMLIVACCGCYGAVNWLSDSRVRNIALSFPACWVLVIFALCLAASTTAILPLNSAVSTISILCIYLMTISALVEIGKRTVLITVFAAISVFVLGSWAVYLLMPSIGVMEEAIPGGEFAVRMSGLSHANTLGQFCGLGVIFGIVLFFQLRIRNLLVVLMVLLAAAALVISLSRTSIAATFLALAIGYRHKLFYYDIIKTLLAAIALSILLVMALSLQVDLDQKLEVVLASFSKSGDTEEITSATGRAEIWAKTVQLIQHRPLLGYGPTSSKFLLEEYSMYTHNLWLNIGLNCGVFGLFMGVIMALHRLYQVFSWPDTTSDMIFLFIVINGCFENVVFSNLCGLPTICLVMSLAWRQIEFEVESRNPR